MNMVGAWYIPSICLPKRLLYTNSYVWMTNIFFTTLVACGSSQARDPTWSHRSENAGSLAVRPQGTLNFLFICLIFFFFFWQHMEFPSLRSQPQLRPIPDPLTHCAGLRILPASQSSRDTTNPAAPQWELLFVWFLKAKRWYNYKSTTLRLNIGFYSLASAGTNGICLYFLTPPILFVYSLLFRATPGSIWKFPG